MTGICDQCAKAPATQRTPTDRGLCDSCHERFVMGAAAGTVLADGGSPEQAVGTGIAAAGYRSSLDVEGEHRSRQRAKLAATEGFWARLKVRIIG